MSLKPYTYNNIIPASTVMNATINSLPMTIDEFRDYAIQIVFTGTPTGSFKLQASTDGPDTRNGASPPYAIPTNWTDVGATSVSVSAAGSIMWNVSDAAYRFVRVVYTDSSGGTSTAVITVSTMNAKI